MPAWSTAIGLAHREAAIARHAQQRTVPFSWQRRGRVRLTGVIQSRGAAGSGRPQTAADAGGWTAIPDALYEWALRHGLTNAQLYAILDRKARKRE